VPGSPISSGTASALRAISGEENLESSDRVLAASKLALLDLPAALAAMASLAEDRSAGAGRLEAARELSWLDRPRAERLLLQITADPAADAPQRVQAIAEVHDAQQEQLAEALEALVADRGIDGTDRTDLAIRLSEIDPARSVPLVQLAADASLSGSDRGRAARVLVTLDSRLGAETLALIAADRSVHSSERAVAAMELAALDPALGASALVVLSCDSAVEGAQRVRAAFELAALDHRRGIDALASVAGDPTTDSSRPQLIRAARLQVLNVRRRAFSTVTYHTVEHLDLPEIEPTRCLSYRIQAIQLLSGYDRDRALSEAEALMGDPDPDIAAQAGDLLQSLAA
jgi:hypothetical protein